MVKTGINTGFFWIMLFSILGCEQSLDCVKSRGKIVQKNVNVADYPVVKVWDELDVVLFNQQEPEMILEAGENLLESFEFKKEDGELHIYNHNACNWSRESGNPKLYVATANLRKIYLSDFSNLYGEDTVRISDLTIYGWGTGDVKLNLVADKLYAYSDYVVNYYLSGEVKEATVHFIRDGQFHGENLLVDHLKLRHEGSNFFKVHPIQSMKGRISSIGNVYYYNDPDLIEVEKTSEGKLIRKQLNEE